MFFSDIFISTISADPRGAALTISNSVLEFVQDQGNNGWNQAVYDVLLEAVSLLSAMKEGNLIQLGAVTPAISGDLPTDCQTIYPFIQAVQKETYQDIALTDYRELKLRFSAALGAQFAYEFSEADITRIQNLITELRQHIANSDYFEDKHRARLLARLEKLQSELHKRVADLDRFWGLIGDAGVALGKFGNDAKPLVDRIREISDIVWNTQAKAEELPSSTPLPLLNHTPTSETGDV